MIGRGAYGEVWMARTLTGSYRAVKVVWRIDYDNEEAFEREFAGIRRYEPVSRRHSGLVDILQIGRNDDEGFYYYIMEIGDDVEFGREIQPESYRPRSFSATTKGGRLPLHQCILYGSRLADALHHLHENDLIHRDVKPSNVIFVHGEPRLADMGLVALSGQRSFVGTEGFVPPEGPGSASADLYSLGMVLYEAATGKDRLDFPDVPSHVHSVGEARQWRMLNAVICKACAPNPADRYASGRDMAEALAACQGLAPEPVAPRPAGALAAVFRFVTILILALAGGWGVSQWRQGQSLGMTGNGAGPVTTRPVVSQPARPLLTIQSEPQGAEVYRGSELLGTTPLELDPPVDQPLDYQLRLQGHRTVNRSHTAAADNPSILEVELERWLQPQEGEIWRNSIGMEFAPRRGGHSAVYPTDVDSFHEFVDAEKRPFEGQIIPLHAEGRPDPVYVVLAPIQDIDAFRAWLYERERTAGYLSPEQAYRVETLKLPEVEDDRIGSVDDLTPVAALDPMETDTREQFAFRLVVERREYGTVHIETMPQGAQVWIDQELVGRTPLTIPRVKTGPARYEVRSEGYASILLEGEVEAEELLRFSVDLEERRAAVFGREWTNSLGMNFVPVGDLLVAVHPVRRGDYLPYTDQTGADVPPPPDQADHEDLPVTRVNRADAQAFAEWLTQVERADGLISDDMEYRLPTDPEWSRMAGLPLERGFDPASRSGRIRGVYPWGFLWPPPAGAGNFADASALEADQLQDVIPDYHDGFQKLAPVGSFAPNTLGIKDLAGNVAEWLADDYGGDDAQLSVFGVVRGGSWRSFEQDELLSSTRLPVAPDTRDATIGFRLVVARDLDRRPAPFDPRTSPATPSGIRPPAGPDRESAEAPPPDSGTDDPPADEPAAAATPGEGSPADQPMAEPEAPAADGTTAEADGTTAEAGDQAEPHATDSEDSEPVPTEVPDPTADDLQPPADADPAPAAVDTPAEQAEPAEDSGNES